MSRKPKWQEQVEEKIERALDPKPAPVATTSDEGRAPDFLWSGRPVYRCQVCGEKYERLENLDAVLRHEEEAHGAGIRVSAILGADGNPLTILEA